VPTSTFDSRTTPEQYADDTELERLDNWSQAVTDSQLQSFFPSNASRSYLNSWARKVTRSSTAGVAADDPLDSYNLTTQQANRAIMFMFEMVSEFRVRIAVVGCCGTGRNFLFAGCESRGARSNPVPPSPSVPICAADTSHTVSSPCRESFLDSEDYLGTCSFVLPSVRRCGFHSTALQRYLTTTSITAGRGKRKAQLAHASSVHFRPSALPAPVT
jgi:hypothetical protein